MKAVLVFVLFCFLWSSQATSEISNGFPSLANFSQLVKDARSLCSEPLWGLWGHCGLRIVRAAVMLGICHPRPGMRFSSRLLLSGNRLTETMEPMLLYDQWPPEALEAPLCDTSRTNWGKLPKCHRATCYLHFAASWAQDKNEFMEVFAVTWVRRKRDPWGCLHQKEIGETKTVHHGNVSIIFSTHTLC